MTFDYKHVFVHQRWTIAIGIVIGFLFSPLSLGFYDMALSTYDNTNPVLNMRGEILRKSKDSLELRIIGTKDRDCLYIGIQAFSENASGFNRQIYISQLDRPLNSTTILTMGMHDMGAWRIWPTDDSKHISVFTQHSCSGRLVMSKVVSIDM